MYEDCVANSEPATEGSDTDATDGSDATNWYYVDGLEVCSKDGEVVTGKLVVHTDVFGVSAVDLNSRDKLFAYYFLYI